MGMENAMLLKRPRRNRKSPALRSLLEENLLRSQDLIAPFFVREGENIQEVIPTFPGVFKHSIDSLLREAEILHKKGVPAVILFPSIHPDLKDESGRQSLREDDVIAKAIRKLKQEIPSLIVMSDIALDPYTSHGHDGLVNQAQEVLNDETVDVLVQMALLHASCGVDVVAPSDMMDGRIRAIRQALEKSGHSQVNILAYAAKYASSLYGPFREALGSALKFGDKKTYQLNPANTREAVLEAALDEEEGADFLMVKPATFYLDVIQKIKAATQLPVGAYHVSGEYAMVMAADARGMLQKERVFLEALLSIKRAGADFIISYAIPLIIDLI